MEKIRNILAPGKAKEDEIMYGAGSSDTNPLSSQQSASQDTSQTTPLSSQHDTPIQDRSSSNPLSSSQNTSTQGHPSHQDTSAQGHSSGGLLSSNRDTSTQNYPPNTNQGLTGESQSAARSPLLNKENTSTSSTAPGPFESSTATGSNTAGRDGTAGRITPASMPSNASIKSNVVGRVPTGSGMLNEQNQDRSLPPVPATGGRFMEDDSIGGSSQTGPRAQSSGDRAFPLAGGTAPSQSSSAYPTNPQGTAANTRPEQTSHTGRDAALAGGAGAAGVGAYEAKKRHDATHEGHDKPSESTGLFGRRHKDTTDSADPSSQHESTGLFGRHHKDTTNTPDQTRQGESTGLFGRHHKDTTNTPDQTRQGESTGLFGRHHKDTTNTPDQTRQGESTGLFGRHHKDTTDTAGQAPYNERHNVPSDSTYGANNNGASNISPTTQRDHHGRDAALAGGAGATGLGAYAANKHHESQRGQQGFGSNDSTSSRHENVGRAEATPASAQSSQGGHSGRDAALAGGAGAAGLGAYEANRHHDSRHGQQGLASNNPTTSRADKVGGSEATPSSSQKSEGGLLGKVASLVGVGGSAGHGAHDSSKSHESQRGESGISNEPTTSRNDNVGSTETTTSSTQHSQGGLLGKVAALAGGSGTTGHGAHEGGKTNETQKVEDGFAYDPITHRLDVVDAKGVPHSTTHAPQTSHSRSDRDAALASGASASGIGAHKQQLDQRAEGGAAVGPGSSGNSTSDAPSSHHGHTGRDGALASGAGAAGLGAYEANKHHHDSQRAEQGGLLGSNDKTGRSDDSPSTTQPTRSSHHGRDAALAGGAGAIGLGAHEDNKYHHDPQQVERSVATSPRNIAGNAGLASSSAQPSQATHLGRDMQATQPGQLDRSSQVSQPDHAGRNAALAGGAGAAGLGAYEAGKHHHDNQRTEPGTATGPRDTVGGAGLAPSSTQPSQTSQLGRDSHISQPGQLGRDTQTSQPSSLGRDTQSSQPSHFGRDAALAGGAGAAGLGAYEANKHHNRNEDRGMPAGVASSSQPGSTAGGVGASSHGTGHQQNIGQDSKPGLYTIPTSTHGEKSRHIPGAYPLTPAHESDKTLGRDGFAGSGTAGSNAVGSGAAGSGAAGIAAREAVKRRDRDYNPNVTSDPNPYNSTTLDPRVDARTSRDTPATASSNIGSQAPRAATGVPIGTTSNTQEPPKGSHHGRDAALAGGAGAAALGAYEGNKRRENETVNDPATTRSQHGLFSRHHDDSATASHDKHAHHSRHHDDNTATVKDKHDHHSRHHDAAIAGGGATGAAGPDRYEPTRNNELNPSYERTAQSGPTTAQTTNFSRPIDSTQPAVGSHQEPLSQRDVSTQPYAASERSSFVPQTAEVGATGAGLGAYDAVRRQHDPSASSALGGPSSSAHEQALGGYDDQRALPSHPAHQTGQETTLGSGIDNEKHHHGRDAALVGGGGVGAGGVGAHEYSGHHDDKLEREREKVAEQKHNEHEKSLSHSDSGHKSKPSLIKRILHPHKSKEMEKEYEQEEESRRSLDSYNEGDREVAGGASPTTSEKHERNRLHKEPHGSQGLRRPEDRVEH